MNYFIDDSGAWRLRPAVMSSSLCRFCLVALFCLSGKFRWGQFKLIRFAASGVFVVIRVWGLVHRDEAAVCLQVNQGAAQRRAAQVRSQSKDTP